MTIQSHYTKLISRLCVAVVFFWGYITLTIACAGGDLPTVNDANPIPHFTNDLSACSGAVPVLDYPVLDLPCQIDPITPKWLAVTTTDFSTGALALLELQNLSLTNDVTLTSSDAIPFFPPNADLIAGSSALKPDSVSQLYIVNRFGYDFVAKHTIGLSATSLAAQAILQGEYPIREGSTKVGTVALSTNPQSISWRTDGYAFITTLGSPFLQLHDFNLYTREGSHLYNINLAAFADADGNPDASLSFSCGDLQVVNLQRLSSTFIPTEGDQLVLVDGNSCTPYRRTIPLLGSWAKQVHQDPRDSNGHTVLLLSSGIEAIDLSTGISTWVIPDTVFEVNHMGSYNLLAFSVSPDGDTLYVAASQSTTFSEVAIWTAPLNWQHTMAPQLTKIIGGLNAVEKTLQVVGNALFFGDRTLSSMGIKHYDLSQSPPQLVTTYPTSLPPYSAVLLP